MSIRQTLALLAGLAALKALPVAGEEYRTLARLTDLFKRDPSRAAALVEVREGPHRFAYRTVPRHPGCRRTRAEFYYEVAVRLGPHFASQPPRRGLAAAQQLFKLTSILCG